MLFTGFICGMRGSEWDKDINNSLFTTLLSNLIDTFVYPTLVTVVITCFVRSHK